MKEKSKKTITRILSFLLVFVVTCGALPQPILAAANVYTIIVKDLKGNPVSDAEVKTEGYFNSTPSQKTESNGYTSATGQFEVNLPANIANYKRYTLNVFVSKENYKTYEDTISLRASEGEKEFRIEEFPFVTVSDEIIRNSTVCLGEEYFSENVNKIYFDPDQEAPKLTILPDESSYLKRLLINEEEIQVDSRELVEITPEGSIEVTAEFGKKIQAVIDSNFEETAFKIFVDQIEADNNQTINVYDDTSKIEILPEDGYLLTDVYVGEKRAVLNNEGSAELIIDANHFELNDFYNSPITVEYSKVYKITVVFDENNGTVVYGDEGSALVTSEPILGKEKEEIKLTITPSEGYRLYQITDTAIEDENPVYRESADEINKYNAANPFEYLLDAGSLSSDHEIEISLLPRLNKVNVEYPENAITDLVIEQSSESDNHPVSGYVENGKDVTVSFTVNPGYVLTDYQVKTGSEDLTYAYTDSGKRIFEIKGNYEDAVLALEFDDSAFVIETEEGSRAANFTDLLYSKEDDLLDPENLNQYEESASYPTKNSGLRLKGKYLVNGKLLAFDEENSISTIDKTTVIQSIYIEEDNPGYGSFWRKVSIPTELKVNVDTQRPEATWEFKFSKTKKTLSSDYSESTDIVEGGSLDLNISFADQSDSENTEASGIESVTLVINDGDPIKIEGSDSARLSFNLDETYLGYNRFKLIVSDKAGNINELEYSFDNVQNQSSSFINLSIDPVNKVVDETTVFGEADGDIKINVSVTDNPYVFIKDNLKVDLEYKENANDGFVEIDHKIDNVTDADTDLPYVKKYTKTYSFDQNWNDGFYRITAYYSNALVNDTEPKVFEYVIDRTAPKAQIKLINYSESLPKTEIITLLSDKDHLNKAPNFNHFTNNTDIALDVNTEDLTVVNVFYFIKGYKKSENKYFLTDDELDSVEWSDTWNKAQSEYRSFPNGNFVAYFKLIDSGNNVAYLRTDGFTVDTIQPNLTTDFTGYEIEDTGEHLPYIRTGNSENSKISTFYIPENATPNDYPLAFVIDYSKPDADFELAPLQSIDYELWKYKENNISEKERLTEGSSKDQTNILVNLYEGKGRKAKFLEGKFELKVSAKDAAGNTAASVTHEVIVTNKIPSISISLREDPDDPNTIRWEKVDQDSDVSVGFTNDPVKFDINFIDLKNSFLSDTQIIEQLKKGFGIEDGGLITIDRINAGPEAENSSLYETRKYIAKFDFEDESEHLRKYNWTYKDVADGCENLAGIHPNSLESGKNPEIGEFYLDNEDPKDLRIEVLESSDPVNKINEWNDKQCCETKLIYNTFSNEELVASFDSADNSNFYDVYYAIEDLSDEMNELGITDLDYQPLGVGSPDLKDKQISLTDGQNRKFVLYLKAVDFAGNETVIRTDGISYDRIASSLELAFDSPFKKEIVKEEEETDKFIFNNDTDAEDSEETIDLVGAITEDTNFSGINNAQIEAVNSDGTSRILWEYKDDTNGKLPKGQIDFGKNDIQNSIKLKKSEFNKSDYTIHLQTTDNAGNTSERKIYLDVDMDAPIVTSELSGERRAESIDSCYMGTTVTFTFIERTEHFDPKAARDAIVIKATDYSGKEVSVNPEFSDWVDSDEMTHKITITFTEDANYEVSLADFKDTSGNAAQKPAEIKFTVDNTAPVGSIRVFDNDGLSYTWNDLIQDLRFGIWTDRTIHVESDQNDETSGIQSVKAYKYVSSRPDAATKALSWNDLDRVSEWQDLPGLVITPDEQATVYLRIVDNAGNYTYISTDGLISDNTDPSVEEVSPEVSVSPAVPHNGYYTDDVEVEIGVVDPVNGNTYSGLNTVQYEVYNLAESNTTPTQSGILFSFDVDNPRQSDLVRTWNGSITVDSELNNSNDVVIRVFAQDNAGNTAEGQTEIQIDITAPEIHVSYDNNSVENEKYFKQGRTATVTVTERNFDPELVITDITSTDTSAPSISNWTEQPGSGNLDNTTWTATIEYSDDSDYTFGISCTDKAGWSNSSVSYAADTVAANEFTVDKTVPTIEVTYDNNSVKNGNYYNADRTATVSVTEHNFTDSRITISLKAEDDGETIDAPKPGSWVHTSGDVYECVIPYNYDGYFTFDIEVTDLAGNDAADFKEQSFYVDKTKPEFKLENVEHKKSYKDDVQPVLTYSDTNIDHDSASIELTGAEKKEIEVPKWGDYSDIKNGKVFTFNNFPKEEDYDDVYHLKAVVSDKAGNSSEPIDILFSANRFGSTYILSAETERVNNSYSKMPVTIQVTEINPSKLSNVTATVYKNEKTVPLTEETDYTIEPSGGEDIWYQHVYTIHADNFKDDGVYRVVLHSEDEAGNIAENSLITKNKEINFGIDSTAPTLVVNNLESGITYPTDALEVNMYPMDNLLLSSVEVFMDNNMQPTESWNQDQVSALIAGDGEFSFTIPGDSTQAHQLSIVCKDAAGNEYISDYEDFYVTTNLWVRFFNNKPLFYGTLALLAAIIAFLIYFFVKKRNRKEQSAQA